MEAVLKGVNGEELAPSLRLAARFLDTTRPEQHLAERVRPGSRFERILEHVQALDHVGFLAPADVAPGLAGEASAAGFDRGAHTFKSTILARQLAELAGREAVSTSIFKARGNFRDAGVAGVEVALPEGIGGSLLREWISNGIGTHVAFRVASSDCFGELASVLTAEGYRMPRFTDGGPLTNPAEGLEAVFFDRRPEELVGLEFCCYEER